MSALKSLRNWLLIYSAILIPSGFIDIALGLLSDYRIPAHVFGAFAVAVGVVLALTAVVLGQVEKENERNHSF